MNKPIDFDLIQRRKALDDWLADCKRRMCLRFPKVEFDADCWPIRALYQAPQADWYFTESMADFAKKDTSYREALRCLVAEIVLAGEPKDISNSVRAYRQLALASPHRLFDLALKDLRRIEEIKLTSAKAYPRSAGAIDTGLARLTKHIAQLSKTGVIPGLGFHIRSDVKAELRKIVIEYRSRSREGRGEQLDRRMEAFNEAFNHMVDGHPGLSSADHVAICTTTLLLCAPSRINEVLCMSVDDHVTVKDYGEKTIGEKNLVHSAHQMLIVTMKGSKGAEWGPKPVLNFMIDVFHYCMEIIKEHGRRSRMLIEWYKENPTRLYLPPELEYLRGQHLNRWDIAKIINLTETPPINGDKNAARHYVAKAKDRQFIGPNKKTLSEGGRRTRPNVTLMAWVDVEALLLKAVHQAMADCRRVTQLNHYDGDLAQMLYLFDDDEVPFLPGAINYSRIKHRLRITAHEGKMPPTLFNKLNITMPVDGKIQIGEMDCHDPRRWLTTMAEIHGEKLSDVLINKWANRCKLSQLKAYDLRTAETMAAQSAMPEAPKLRELTDLSNGLATMEKLEDQFGLKTAIVTAHDAGIAVTSMETVAEAIENRPVAKSSRGIIIIYPQRFGVCFHQHHEKPCRNYSNELSLSCITCNEGADVKGHIPTNDELRRIAPQLFNSILRHLENLALTHNRGIADDPAMLGEHMLTLVERGLDRMTMLQLANHLIDNFHELNHLIKDRQLASRLHQAFVAHGKLKIIDDPIVASGALIKYHNPTQHAEPLLEVALDAHGGREQVAHDEQALIAKHPQFAPKSLGLTDQRHLIAPDDDEGEN